MSTISDTGPLTDARHRLDEVRRGIAGAVPTEGDLRATVEGVHDLTAALATLVSTLMDQVPEGVSDEVVAKEVVADLRAMHGCLTTSTLLLAPALDDLRGLTSPKAASVPRQQNRSDLPMPVPA